MAIFSLIPFWKSNSRWRILAQFHKKTTNSTVILSQIWGSTQNKMLKAIFLMSFIFTNVFLLFLKPDQEKTKGII
jgi:uncharacterized protein (DUF1684 family)